MSACRDDKQETYSFIFPNTHPSELSLSPGAAPWVEPACLCQPLQFLEQSCSGTQSSVLFLCRHRSQAVFMPLFSSPQSESHVLPTFLFFISLLLPLSLLGTGSSEDGLRRLTEKGKFLLSWRGETTVCSPHYGCLSGWHWWPFVLFFSWKSKCSGCRGVYTWVVLWRTLGISLSPQPPLQEVSPSDSHSSSDRTPLD